MLGPDGLLYDTPERARDDGDPAQLVQRGYLASRAASIASGTSEIMQGIIAMQFLGLPRGRERGARSGCGGAGRPGAPRPRPCAPRTRPLVGRRRAQGCGVALRAAPTAPTSHAVTSATPSCGCWGDLRRRLLVARAAGGGAVRGARVAAGVRGGGARRRDAVPLRRATTRCCGGARSVGGGLGVVLALGLCAALGAASRAGRSTLSYVEHRAGLPVVPVGQPAARVGVLRALRHAGRLAAARGAAAASARRVPDAVAALPPLRRVGRSRSCSSATRPGAT